MLLQLFQYSLNGFYVLYAFAFDIGGDVIKVHYQENIEVHCQDLIDVLLECGYCISQSKRYHLVLEMAIAGPEDRLLFIAFPDPHLMINNY